MATTSFLVNHHITVAPRDAKNIQDTLEKAFDVFVSRLASLVAVTTLSNGTHVAGETHVAEVRRLLFNIKSIDGGGLPAEYYGDNTSSPSYGMGVLNMNTDTVDFNNGTARPEISGGGKKILSPLVQHVVTAMKIHKVKCSTSASDALTSLISEYTDSLAEGLGQGQGQGLKLTLKKLVATLSHKDLALFF